MIGIRDSCCETVLKRLLVIGGGLWMRGDGFFEKNPFFEYLRKEGKGTRRGG